MRPSTDILLLHDIAAIDDEEACGRVLAVVSPEPLPFGALALRIAESSGRRLKVRRLARWALGPLRLFGRRPFVLPDRLLRSGAIS